MKVCHLFADKQLVSCQIFRTSPIPLLASACEEHSKTNVSITSMVCVCVVYPKILESMVLEDDCDILVKFRSAVFVRMPMQTCRSAGFPTNGTRRSCPNLIEPHDHLRLLQTPQNNHMPFFQEASGHARKPPCLPAVSFCT